MANSFARPGTLHHPSRAVPGTGFARLNEFGGRFSSLVQNAKLVREVLAKYRREASQPANARTLDLPASLFPQTCFSLGFYCESELWRHRSLPRQLLIERGAIINPQ